MNGEIFAKTFFVIVAVILFAGIAFFTTPYIIEEVAETIEHYKKAIRKIKGGKNKDG